MFKHDMSIVVRSEGTVNIESVFADDVLCAKSALVPTRAISGDTLCHSCLYRVIETVTHLN